MDENQINAEAAPAESHGGPVSTETRNFRPALDMPVRPLEVGALSFGRGLKERRKFYDAMVEELKDKYKIAIRKWALCDVGRGV